MPRANRCIFAINELPDLQPRIQVALFNILQEGDIQIRGFKMRLPLDIQFIFTANPEDYTNRGSIVTPLKDRIESQILTHYPSSVEIGKRITAQEAHIKPEQEQAITVPEMLKDLIEQIAVEARTNEYVDTKSGVSARMTIAAYENLLSAAERRILLNNEKQTQARISDFWSVLPAITGKIELVYEGEQEGAAIVAQNLIGKAIRTLFTKYFPNPEQLKKQKLKNNPYQQITAWFEEGNKIEILQDASNKQYEKALQSVAGLKELVAGLHGNQDEAIQLVLMELALHGLAEFSVISRNAITKGLLFKDLLSSMFFDKLDKNDFDDDEDM